MEPRGGLVFNRTQLSFWARCLTTALICCLPARPIFEARTYSRDDVSRKIDQWVPWMLSVITAAAPKVKGLIAVNCEGQTRGYAYQPAPFLLVADLYRAGFNLRKPPIFHRVGIPGSGGPDWLRNDYEPIICVTREGKLPWSDNVACGHPPKWAPGGAMSHRLADGQKVNQWGMRVKADDTLTATEPTKDGAVARRVKPSHRTVTNTKKMYSRNPDGTRDENEQYEPPAVANPGNVLTISVGGGMMGSPLSHENEAPFPLELAAFFVKSFCPPNGIVADCFSGSGTTCHATIENGRRFVGCDLRESQILLTERRMKSGITPDMFSDCSE